MSARWMVIPNWEKFQHYKTRSGESVMRPEWIKNYGRLLHDDAYLKLTLRQRGILHGIWLLYASSGQQLGSGAAQLGRLLGEDTVRVRDIEALSSAGFIEFSSRPNLDEVYTSSSPELELEIEKATAVRVVASDPQPLAAEPRRLLERLRNMSQERKAS